MGKGKINERILILCEGITEYLYAKSLQIELPRDMQRSISIEVSCHSHNDPKSLADEAKRRLKIAQRERNSFSKIWLFFDKDDWPQLDKAFEIINKEGFEVAYSSICIEHWFILHFEDCGKTFSKGEDALKHLLKLWPQYHKTRTNAYKELKGRMELARKRAEILSKNQSNDIVMQKKNPYFTIHKLIGYFENLKEKK